MCSDVNKASLYITQLCTAWTAWIISFDCTSFYITHSVIQLKHICNNKTDLCLQLWGFHNYDTKASNGSTGHTNHFVSYFCVFFHCLYRSGYGLIIGTWSRERLYWWTITTNEEDNTGLLMLPWRLYIMVEMCKAWRQRSVRLKLIKILKNYIFIHIFHFSCVICHCFRYW